MFASSFLQLGPLPFYPFLRGGSPTKIDYRKMGTLILPSLLEDLAKVHLAESGKDQRAGWGELLSPTEHRRPFLAVPRENPESKWIAWPLLEAHVLHSPP